MINLLPWSIPYFRLNPPTSTVAIKYYVGVSIEMNLNWSVHKHTTAHSIFIKYIYMLIQRTIAFSTKSARTEATVLFDRQEQVFGASALLNKLTRKCGLYIRIFKWKIFLSHIEAIYVALFLFGKFITLRYAIADAPFISWVSNVILT